MKTIKGTKKKTKKSSQATNERKLAQEKEKEVTVMKMAVNMVNAIGDGLILIDMEGKIIFVNPAWEKMTGYKSSEVVGRDAVKVAQKMHKPEDVKKLIRALKTAMGGNVPSSFIYTLIKKNGQEIPITYTPSFVRDAKGKPTKIVGVVKDITEIKKIEEKLKESEEKFRNIFENVNDVILSIDKRGKIISVNKRAEDIFGYKRDELIGRNFTRVGFIQVEDLPRILKFFMEATRKNGVIRPLVELRVKDKKGNIIPVEVSIRPIGKNGKLECFLNIIRDVSERKKAERALLEEKNKLRKYLDTAGIIILILNPEGKVLFLNKKGSEILGYKGREILGKDWLINFIPEKNRVKVRKIFGKVIGEERNRVGYFECSILTKDGKERIINWYHTLLKDEQDKIQAVLVAGADITELKEAKLTIEQLRELDKLKDDFLNIATHELRTPLTSIIGFTEIIREQKPFLALPYRKYIDIINTESIRLAHIIRLILTVTRFESGRETVQIEPFDLATFVSSLLPNLNILTKRKKTRIVTNIEKKNIAIRSDKEKIKEVIYNLVDNALKYGPEGQTITISMTKPKKGWVKIAIRDQGPGITPELQQRLFTKFSQLEPSLTRSKGGTGLGLYICKLIVDMLGGKIGVKSVLGKGSTFYFILPINKSSKSPSVRKIR